MKVLVDENIGSSVVQYLLSEGHNVIWIKELRPGMSDKEILKLALKTRRIIITYDQDFGELIFLKGERHYGVILIRPRLDTISNHLRILKQFFEKYSAREIAGKFWKLDERFLL